jgi:hypothetical protein
MGILNLLKITYVMLINRHFLINKFNEDISGKTGWELRSKELLDQIKKL